MSQRAYYQGDWRSTPVSRWATKKKGVAMIGLNDVKYLELIIGKSSRVYEVLNRQRPLTLALAMIRRLHQGLGIPPNVLIAETMAG